MTQVLDAPGFEAPYAPDDTVLIRALLERTAFTPQATARIDTTARRLVEALRTRKSWFGGVDDMLHAFGLTSDEGLALMVLAEALLRIPDGRTADALIEDKLGAETWNANVLGGKPFVVASAWALAMGSALTAPEDQSTAVVARLVKRLGRPTVRQAVKRAMAILGDHFVLGQTIDEALKRSRPREARGYEYSYDMLGEGARTGADADRYFSAYRDAILAIGASAGDQALPARPGISIKLSALHPRYEATQADRVMRELTPRVLALALAAKDFDLAFTIDAEEAARLELSLEVFAAVAANPGLEGWAGFGLAVQAYQKRATAVIDWVIDTAARLDRQFMVRLVKGAYWDTEIKHAQELGLADYPVFTRRAATDLSYTACAKQIHDAGPRVFGQFATHNAVTVASVLEIYCDRPDGFEFQALHGMGGELYAHVTEAARLAPCRIYAPVGGHKDLLAYLVRRLLENGANTSFVNTVEDDEVSIDELVRQPAAILADGAQARHGQIPLPADLFGAERVNSSGVEFGDRAALRRLVSGVGALEGMEHSAASLIDGVRQAGEARGCVTPSDPRQTCGEVVEADAATAERALEAAAAGFGAWNSTPVEVRAEVLRAMADTLERHRDGLLSLIAREAGRTLEDGVDEVREAVDFCRYYAARAVEMMGQPAALPGPTGEDNLHQFGGRGPFVCISPWNFPLAIFTGQLAAALVTGNTVVAKPAEQTPLVAHKAVELFHQAGAPTSALQLVLGDGDVGAALTRHPLTAGVAFTGSTQTAWAINRALAARDAAIAPLIAETGGINAMVVDATALPEQVTDDVMASAFRSAGQRCSALRLLCLQDDIADTVLDMIEGAAAERVLGDPTDPATDIGPVIDTQAHRDLMAYVDAARAAGTLRFSSADSRQSLPGTGYFVAPHIIELDRPEDLTREVFGPILHVVRYNAKDLEALIEAINASGFGLTFAVHSRITATSARLAACARAGNVYVNRNQVGAVVGVQPFGGQGLSGTGPKAGGPAYLYRFVTEKVISTNTAAIGGNTTLVSLRDEGE